ncbi:uncharacterized protein LOC129724713 [Wyeomyia smithii]|uniref:uncharacterized protein LOC129724713 n=1 Tax=Wyeomyia smithii TaxID=174621 RepID=UPI00246801CE|nr:uncharacterized protein LOC129724713 [Wyeomyia smithii]XP_055535820.1 uncharacterized protein LOC129724713 [Wyeomyia smithii]
MNKSFVLLLAIAGCASAISRCTQPTKHYSEMGCTPSNQQNGQGCPVSYNWPSLRNRQSSKCFLFGKDYDLDEYVPDTEFAPQCVKFVKCRQYEFADGHSSARFAYAKNECYETRSENCVKQYELDMCCSMRVVCDDDRNKLVRCNVSGHSYYEGERIEIPGDPCGYCICAAGFDETNLSSYGSCMEYKCAFKLDETFDDGVIPVYQDGICCPTEWRLPNSTDKLVKSAVAIGDPNLQCKYGAITMHVGDSLEPVTSADGTNKCSCAIPPLAHCKFEQKIFI